MSNPSDWFETAQSPASVATTTSAAQPPVAPAIAAAASPVATLTAQQLDVIMTAAHRQLSQVGVAAFITDMFNTFEVADLGQIPADQQRSIMASLSNATNRAQWDQGNSQTGDPLLGDEELAALRVEPDATPEPGPAAEASTTEEAEDDGVGQMELA